MRRGPGMYESTHMFNWLYMPPYYDSLIAKIITVGATRITRLIECVGTDEYYITH